MQPDKRHLVGEREFLRVDALAQSRRVRRAAFHGEVLAAHGDPASVHLAKAEHVVGGLEIDEVSLLVEVRHPCAFAHLLEGAFIGEGGNALAYGEPALLMMPLHRLLAALALREFPAAPDLVGFLFPAHLSGVLPVAKSGNPKGNRVVSKACWA